MGKYGNIALILTMIGLGSVPLAAQSRVPKYEVAAGYSYVRANLVTKDGCCFAMNGASGSFTWNTYRSLGLTADLGFYRKGNVKNTGLDLTVVSYTIGPQLAYRKTLRFTPYAHVLFGGGHAGSGLYRGTTGFPGLGANNSWDLLAGGGGDFHINPRLSWRNQVDYFFSKFRNAVNNRQNSIRFTTGIVFKFGDTKKGHKIKGVF